MLTKDHIYLRPIDKDDLIKTLKWRNNTDLTKQLMSHPFPITREMEYKWYDKVLNDTSNNSIYFAICTVENNELIGLVYLTDIDWISRICKFHILIGEENARGKGFGKETLELMIYYIFNTLHLRKIVLEVVSNNNAAIKLYENCGFKTEGILIEQYYTDYKYYNIKIMSLFGENMN